MLFFLLFTSNVLIILGTIFWMLGFSELCRFFIYWYIIKTPIILFGMYLIQCTYIDLAHIGCLPREGHPLRFVLGSVISDNEVKGAYIRLFYLLNKESFLMTLVRRLSLLIYCALASKLWLMNHYYLAVLLLIVEFYKLTVWEFRTIVKKLYPGRRNPQWLLDKRAE